VTVVLAISEGFYTLSCLSCDSYLGSDADNGYVLCGCLYTFNVHTMLRHMLVFGASIKGLFSPNNLVVDQQGVGLVGDFPGWC